MLYLNLSAKRYLASANSHFYPKPTEPHYLDRTLEYHDFIFMDRGGWSMTEGEEEFVLREGDVLLLSAGRHHYNKYGCLPETKTFCLHVSVDLEDSKDSMRSSLLPTHFHVTNREKIRSLFNELVSLYWSNIPCKEARIQAILSVLLFEIYDEYRNSSQGDVASQAIAILEEEPHRRFETKEMADLLFVTPKTLNNAMNKLTGMPFYAYEKNRKLEMAALQLVLEPELRLSEIASSFGFHDEFHLSKVFKKKYGLSPSEYRTKVDRTSYC